MKQVHAKPKSSMFGVLAKLAILAHLFKADTSEGQVFFQPRQIQNGGRMAFSFDRHKVHLGIVKARRGIR